MSDGTHDGLPPGVRAESSLPETPHELPIDRAKVDALLDRLRGGETVDLRDELMGVVEWRRAFAGEDGRPLDLDQVARLIAYYREKFADIGPIYIAELLSTEFMTEQRGRGDIVFSPRLLELGRTDPALWTEIRQFFRRKEFATALMTLGHRDRVYEAEQG